MGVYLSSPKTDKASQDGENDKLRYGLSSMQGWRTTMEDAHAAYPDLDSSTSFFGVYDGHGGQAVAKFCAKYLHEQVLKHESYLSGDLGTSLQKAFLRMDEMMRGQRGWRELSRLGDNMEKVSGMIEGLIWSPRSGQVNGHFDDWLDEEAYDMSKDHKPGLEVERERIRNAGGFIVVGRVNGTLNLSRAIGDTEFKQNKKLPAEQQIVTANPDIKTVDLCDDDEFLVLACDGIWDCMSSQQLVDYVHEQLNTETKLSVICERVFNRCLAPNTNGGEGCDNMSMILVQFKRPVQAGPSAEQQPTSSRQSLEVDRNNMEK
ncbi:probable protein phosphatase 2C 60 isoform X2 [Populus nigra]|uniref:probable protein phosphatase 2C 60 isoform X2 n=1 Tax=Populus nigra TaxID=3691 RepID=UPI002B26996B|nr:probable protein phosphatase 2C 60 isoform X2 [Populus nigra]